MQDRVLRLIDSSSTEFYLTGGTALSRCYLEHRYSDDLDLFLNFSPGFQKQAEIVRDLLKSEFDENFKIQIDQHSFKRYFVIDSENDIYLKIELVNDVVYRYKKPVKKTIFSKVDNWRNILSNKITALSRNAPKDWVDILYISYNYNFNWIDIIDEAKEKDDWVDEIKVARYLYDVEVISDVKFIGTPDANKMIKQFKVIAKDILKGNSNSLMVNSN